MRDLTQKEKNHIKAVKDRRNTEIRAAKKRMIEEYRKHARREKEAGRRGYLTVEMKKLQEARDAMYLLKGTPVYFEVEGEKILLNYDTIKKALRLTHGLTRVTAVEGLYLEIKYTGNGVKGKFEFIQLPDHYRTLQGLPTIELERTYY